jgi:hypothetical protein
MGNRKCTKSQHKTVKVYLSTIRDIPPQRNVHNKFTIRVRKFQNLYHPPSSTIMPHHSIDRERTFNVVVEQNMLHHSKLVLWVNCIYIN